MEAMDMFSHHLRQDWGGLAERPKLEMIRQGV
jgi:hypothetical protein